MATMVVEPVFVDTNNLIYAQQAHSPFNTQAIEMMVVTGSRRAGAGQYG
jgi:hypothetical protein